MAGGCQAYRQGIDLYTILSRRLVFRRIGEQAALWTSFPVIPAINSNGRMEKLDLDGLNYKETVDLLNDAYERDDFLYIQMMFHSFSLLSQKPVDGYSEVLVDCKDKKVYGTNKQKYDRLVQILDYIESDPRLPCFSFFQAQKFSVRRPNLELASTLYCFCTWLNR